jgi:hypothetical protein
MFVEWAKAMPTIYSEWPEALLSGPSEKARRSPERSAKIAEVRPLAAAIIARKPVAEVRRLFEDENPMSAHGRQERSSRSIPNGRQHP